MFTSRFRKQDWVSWRDEDCELHEGHVAEVRNFDHTAIVHVRETAPGGWSREPAFMDHQLTMIQSHEDGLRELHELLAEEAQSGGPQEFPGSTRGGHAS